MGYQLAYDLLTSLIIRKPLSNGFQPNRYQTALHQFNITKISNCYIFVASQSVS